MSMDYVTFEERQTKTQQGQAGHITTGLDKTAPDRKIRTAELGGSIRNSLCPDKTQQDKTRQDLTGQDTHGLT